MTQENDWIGYKEAAQLINKKASYLRVLKSKKKLPFPHYVVGREILFRKSEIIAYLHSCKVEEKQ